MTYSHSGFSAYRYQSIPYCLANAIYKILYIPAMNHTVFTNQDIRKSVMCHIKLCQSFIVRKKSRIRKEKCRTFLHTLSCYIFHDLCHQVGSPDKKNDIFPFWFQRIQIPVFCPRKAFLSKVIFYKFFFHIQSPLEHSLL